MSVPSIEWFLCDRQELLARIDAIDPVAYAQSRNYLNGSVSWLSPFITHGIIDTTLVAQRLLTRYPYSSCEKFLFELAWREYFHRVWQKKDAAIFSDMHAASGDLFSEQPHSSIPVAVLQARTGINVVDQSLRSLMEIGAMHNHARLWIASIVCNVARTDWRAPAKWMHYNLLDGDLASNTLSWQWVAGTFSKKRYWCNQENINRYSGVTQSGTFLDHGYDQIAAMPVPQELHLRSDQTYYTEPPGSPVRLEPGDVALRSVWNLDGLWQPHIEQQVLFIDEAHHEEWPMNQNRWRFILHWAKQISRLRVMRGSVEELHAACEHSHVYSREYTALKNWPRPSDQRTWLFPEPAKAYNSFFAYWNQVKKTELGCS